ncbi:endonuclease domain-containing protein [Kitasatospora indigofera]|uniref:endonuclease domain-containing protein n=1 Tax=Kitasatospora indigofera TaxID=67307 RepID=UPI0036831944
MDQGGLCPACGEHLGKFDKDVVIDHDHSCCPKRTSCGECVRGILHRRCNSVIGYLGDDPDKFERIAAYLRGAETAFEIYRVLLLRRSLSSL